jgi:hypothetical protein
MGYSTEEDVVRVDLFKPSGKWYMSVALKWTGGWTQDTLIHDAFRQSLHDEFKGSMSGMQAVCLEPYHELAHPLSVML